MIVAPQGGQAGDVRLSGLHALLHGDPARTLQAWSQAGRKAGRKDPGAYRRGSPQALASRHLGGRHVAWAGLSRLARLLRRSGVGPVAPHVPSQAATPVVARDPPPVPAPPLRLEAIGAHDRDSLATRDDPPPMAGPAVCRQAPEVGAGWITVHVRICAGSAQHCAFLPRLGDGARQRPRLPGHFSESKISHCGSVQLCVSRPPQRPPGVRFNELPWESCRSVSCSRGVLVTLVRT